MTTAVIAGGVGAARFLAGLVDVCDPASVTAIVNVADDCVLHGLSVSPDIDTVTYTLAGVVNPETGWGRTGETWRTMEALETLGGETWFRLGDQDLATHLYRTHRLSQGATLAEVTAEVARALGVATTIVPATNDTVRTRITLATGDTVDFQDWFVGMRHEPAVAAVDVVGATEARPAAGVCEAVAAADTVVIAPSNPVVSVGPVLAVPDIAAAVEVRREAVVAVSPIIAGKALKGPADRLLTDLGHVASVVGVAAMYAPVAATLVIDTADAHLAPEVEAAGMRCVVAPTIMTGPAEAAALARTVLEAT